MKKFSNGLAILGLSLVVMSGCTCTDIFANEAQGIKINASYEHIKERMITCMNMLNDVRDDSFGAECGEVLPEEIKKPVFLTKEEDQRNRVSYLQPADEMYPEDAYMTYYRADYYKIQNFKSFEDVNTYLNKCFTKSYVQSLESNIKSEIVQDKGSLYLRRTDKDCSEFTVDIAGADFSNAKNGIVKTNMLAYGEVEYPVIIEFKEENYSLKINNVISVEHYNLDELGYVMKELRIPDFITYATDGAIKTTMKEIEKTNTGKNSYEINYYGSYYESLIGYRDLLAEEGFYTTTNPQYVHDESVVADKKVGNKLITVLGDPTPNGVMIRISVEEVK